MRKLTAVFLSTAMILGLTACGGQETADTAQGDADAGQEEAASVAETELKGDQEQA